MTKYKLIALDMDGTLLNDQLEISKENEKWINKALQAGVTVSFSTGRGFPGANPYAEQLKLNTPMITVNGSEVWSKPHVLHKRITLGYEKIEQLHQLALQYPDVWFWAYSTQGIYNKENWLEEGTHFSDYEWLKFGYHTEDDQAREEILTRIKEWDLFEVTNSSPWNLELNPKGITKASGIRELCKLLDIQMSETIAVGDSLNDIAAIRACGVGVAMGNAQEAVKSAADAVTLTNNENGVAEVIKRFVFGQ